MRPYVSDSLSSVSISNPIQVDHEQNSFEIGIFLTVIGTNTSTAQYSGDDPNADYATDYNTDATWHDVLEITDATASTAIGVAVPIRAVRLNMTARTSGSAFLTVVQGLPT